MAKIARGPWPVERRQFAVPVGEDRWSCGLAPADRQRACELARSVCHHLPALSLGNPFLGLGTFGDQLFWTLSPSALGAGHRVAEYGRSIITTEAALFLDTTSSDDGDNLVLCVRGGVEGGVQ